MTVRSYNHKLIAGAAVIKFASSRESVGEPIGLG